MPLSRINSASIANSAVAAADIADGTITAAKIISVANTQITGNIVSSQIAPSVTLTTPLISGNLNFDATGTSGIRLTSANTLTFHTVGTEDFRIDANGNMGIGGSVDNHGGYGRCLQISASAGAALELEDGSSYSYLAQNGTTLQIRNNDASGNIVFSTNATERARIDLNGNLLFNSGYGSSATAYGCRAWVNFDGTGTPAIRASGNISSITDNSAGNYFLNFTTAMPDGNYSAAGSVYDNAAVCFNTWETTRIGIYTRSIQTGGFPTGAVSDYPTVNAAIFR